MALQLMFVKLCSYVANLQFLMIPVSVCLSVGVSVCLSVGVSVCMYVCVCQSRWSTEGPHVFSVKETKSI